MANRFHKLKNNNSDFPIIGNVDVYKYDNDFNYARYIPDQMDVLMCTVPWDMGEAHIGARTISGIGNVVYFGSAAARDAWFAAIPDDECYRFSTKYKELHRDLYIDVPVPFDVCAKYNYIAVSYSLFANDDSPVMYEHDGGVRKWFWFIREVEFLAANNTRLHILDDAFQTWIYDVHVSGMILERGHAPMFSMKAAQYLANPVENCEYLLTDDVNFGNAGIVKHVDALALNAGTMYACIATTANPAANWGTKAGDSWTVPVSAYYGNQGAPGYYVFAVAVTDFYQFLVNVNNNVPQFRQTVQGVFFASSDLITLQESFTFAGTTCHTLTAARKTVDLCELNKSLFGYSADYADIAKLYTSPYAHIEITDESGNVDIIRIEDSTGNLDVSVALSLAFPFVTIDAHLLGAGGSAGATVTYRNIDSHTFDVSGQWYETLRTWQVPIFAIVLSPQDEYDYATHFDRKQRVVDYTTAYDNASASATATKDTADARAGNLKTNADASADMTHANAYTISNANKANADRSADTVIANALVQRTANTAIQTTSAAAADDDTDYANALSQALQAWEAGYARDTANNQVNAAYASAAIGAAGGAINSAISGGMSGASAGPAGAIAGAVGGLVSGAISGATSMAQTAVAANLTTTQAEATVVLSQNKVTETSTNNTDRTTNQNDANEDNKDTTNSAIAATSNNSASNMKTNATATKNAEQGAADATQTTDKANNLRTYNVETAANTRTYNMQVANASRTRSQAISDIANDIAQAGLRTPFVCGNFANGDGSTTKPIALFANIVTQSKSAISSAGDEFLRYGYMFDKQWDFDGNWNVGKYFTYWKLRDFWVSNLNVPDMYMDKLRFFLFGGVTIWRDPADIGKKSIYENFNG